MRGGLELLRFNGGLVSRFLVARLDLRKLGVCATVMSNWAIRSVGYMFLRPGLQYIGGIASGTAVKMMAFVKATDDTAVVEATTGAIRVRVDDALITFPVVATVVANPSFIAGTDWTDLDEVGGVSTVGGDFMTFTSNGTALAIRQQQVTVAAPDQGIEHCLAINVNSGPVYIRVGTAAGDDDLVSETALACGQHRLAFTPGVSFYIRFQSALPRLVTLASCNTVTGVMSITTQWGSPTLPTLRYDQSGDVIFVASSGAPRRIERRGIGRSWSWVVYAPEDGPFMTENVTTTTITPSALTGNITLTASRPLFKSTNAPDTANDVGSLFSLSSTGQTVTASITAQNTFTTAIRVVGVGTSRAFTVNISNTFVATVTLQRSLDSSTGPWTDTTSTWTAPVATSINDALDNQIAWYRIGVKTGGFTSGTVDVRLSIGTGSIRGIARVTGFTSTTVVSAEVLSPLGATTATDIWQEGLWSARRRYPTAVRFHGLRLWWAGMGKTAGSISDAFDSFDETFEGDAGPINRSLPSGVTDRINWIASLRRLIFGAQGAEVSAISSSLDEPLTPVNFDPRATSNQGSGQVDAVVVDQGLLFVNRSGMKLFLLTPDSSGFDYVPTDMLGFNPEAGYPGIVSLAVSRQPETRAYAILSDGTCLVMLLNAAEDVRALSLIETDGDIVDVLVMPAPDGELDDRVRMAVTRTVGGVPTTYIEKMALETEVRGGVANKTCDSFVYYSGASTATITGLGHLEGEEVVVWADGARVSQGHGDDQTVFTVTGGQITLLAEVTTACVGLAYRAPWQSTKLAYLAERGKSALGARKKVHNLGLVLADTDRGSLRYGPDFDSLDPLPEIEFYEEAPQAIEDLEGDMIEFPSADWTTDSRVCLEADSPGCAHMLAMTIDMDSSK